MFLGFMEKSEFKRGRFTKNQYIGGDCLKRGAWTVCRLKDGEREGLGNMHTMIILVCPIYDDDDDDDDEDE